MIHLFLKQEFVSIMLKSLKRAATLKMNLALNENTYVIIFLERECVFCVILCISEMSGLVEIFETYCKGSGQV